MPEHKKEHAVYILECADGTYYTGYTNDVDRRLQAHQNGKAAKYTRGRTPVRLIYQESYETKQEAMKREYAIKRLPRQRKDLLVREGIENEAAKELSKGT